MLPFPDYGPSVRLALAALACYRLTMLFVFDDGPAMIFFRLRDWLGANVYREGTADHKSWTGDFITCPYCVGQWVALALMALLARPTWIGDVFLLWQGLAGAQAALQSLGHRGQD